MKILKIIYIICPIILSIVLALNIYKYYNNKQAYNSLIKNNDNYNNQIKEIETRKQQFEATLSSLKEEQKDKIKEYERWKKWEKEIQEKMN